MLSTMFEDLVTSNFPEARAIEFNYGHGHRKEWKIMPQPWTSYIGKGFSENEAWAAAASTIRGDL